MRIDQLTIKQYEEGASLALANAKAHLIVSEKANETENHGIAHSLMVISLEELSKASMLKIKAINPNIKIKQFDKYFRQHSVKHESILKIFLASNIYEDNKDSKQTDKSFWTALLAVIALIAIILFLNKSIKDKALDTSRNSGFYLDFKENENLWANPNDQFNKNTYNNFREIVETAFDTIESTLFGGKVTEDNIIAFTDQLDDERVITAHLKEIKGKIK